MRLSTKGRYATRIMLRLAMNYGKGPCPKKEISEQEGISADYIEQIVMRLKTAGLVRSHRGLNGGFTLSREPSEVTVADILKATEDSTVLAPCQEGECDRASACVTRKVWERAWDAMESVLSGTSLADLAGQMVQLSSGKAANFSI